MTPREDIYDEGGFYEKPRHVKQAEIDNERYPDKAREEKK